MPDDAAADAVRELLGLAAAETDPMLQALSFALQRPGGGAQIAAALADCVERGGAIESGHLGAAIGRVAELLNGTGPAAFEPVDRHVGESMLSIVAELVPSPWCERAEQALLHSAFQAGTEQAATQSPPPRIVGRYALLERLGEGSSAVVFRAVHRDSEHPAALKLLRLDSFGADQVARFRDEARIAASLSHPGLVRILDSGVHDDGGLLLPWIATEMIEGRPFDEFAQGRDLAQVCTVFASVCDAVAHAHERGVVHRDLKPRNVLVDAADQAHVIDFGIAKRTQAGAASATRSGFVLGTPAFMAPELARRGAVAASSSSDVWSLGAILFEALAGVTPHDLTGLDQQAALRHLAEAPIRRLDSLRPDLPRDLVAIVHTAIAPEPERRYGAAAALRDDVQRFLAGQAVIARDSTLLEDLRRFVRRHRRGSIAAGVAALGVLCGGTLAAVQLRRATVAEQIQQRAAAEARIAAAGAFAALASTARFASEVGESTKTSDHIRSLLDEPIGLFPAMIRMVPESERGRWLRLEAQLREIAGDAALRSWDWPVVHEHRSRVLEIERALAEEEQTRTRDLARALVKFGDIDTSQQRWAAALVHYQDAHAIYEELQRAAPDEPGALDDLSWSQERCSFQLLKVGRAQLGLSLARDRLSIVGRLVEIRPNAASHHGLAAAIAYYLECFFDRGFGPAPPHAEALDLAERAVQSIGVAVQNEPDRRTYRLREVHVWQTLARARRRAGDDDGAREALARASSRAAELLELDPGDHTYRDLVAHTWRDCALFTAATGQWSEAEPMFEMAVAEVRALAADPDGGNLGHTTFARLAWEAATRYGGPDAGSHWAARYDSVLRAFGDRPGANRRDRFMLARWEIAEAPPALRDRLSGLARLRSLVADDECLTDDVLRVCNPTVEQVLDLLRQALEAPEPGSWTSDAPR